jgi:hypothetical protein
MTATPKGEKKPTVSPTAKPERKPRTVYPPQGEIKVTVNYLTREENPTLAKMQDRERDILRSLPAYQEAAHAAD